ncbi:MAG: PAS domain S-box protein [Rhodospirillales bacterium]|nr:PAS domain S-box protein [Rhodospirillales bacterium]
MNDAQYLSLLKTMPSGFALHEIICDETGTPCDYRFLQTNKAFNNILAIKTDEYIGKTIKEIAPNIESHWIKIFGQVALEGNHVEFESYAEPFNKFFSVTAYCPNKGQFVAIFRDITEHKKLEKTSQLNERRFRDIVECSMESIWEVDENFRFTFLDSSNNSMLGYTLKEIIGKTPFEFMPPKEAIRVKQVALELIEKNKPFSRLESINIHKNGQFVFFSTSGVPIFTKRGKFKGYRGVNLDITEHKEIQKQLEATAGALTESEERFRSLQEFFPTAIGLHESGHFVDANEALENLTGFSLEELRAHQNLELIAEESHAIVRQNIARGFDGTYEVTGKRKDGSTYPLELQGTNIPYKGKVLRITEFRDLTERKATEARLRQSQKLEAIGQLTGGIAHDFNNILGIIQGNLELLQRKIPNDQSALDRLSKALSGTKRAAKLTEKLLGFSRPEAHGTQLTSINEFIRNMEELITKSLTVSIKVESHLAEDLWFVKIDPGDLEDAILNLALNARDAMPDGGTLVIETANKTLDENYAQRNQTGQAGDFVMFSVSDTGMGMSPEVKERIFEPFFSTKEAGKGTGLGLSMVYGFTQRSNGHIKIYSELDEGTTFRIYLPRARRSDELQDTPQGAIEDLPHGTETILVVDDENALAEVATLHLKELGYNVLIANQAIEALEILEQMPEIDLLFSDIVMPGGMDGYQLAIKATKKYPNLKILLTSGFTKKREEQLNQNNQLIASLASNLLNKPYNKIELATSIRQTLDHE